MDVWRWAQPRPGTVACLLGLALSLVYLSTASTGPALVNDTRAAVIGSWSLGSQGSVYLPDGWPPSANYWGVETHEGRVAVNRFPATAYAAAPAYAVQGLVQGRDVPAHPFLVDPAPAAWTAAVTTAGAMVVVFLLLRRERLEADGGGVEGTAGGPGRRSRGSGVGRGTPDEADGGRSLGVALVAAVGLGLGTAAWSVAADALWPHGLTMLGLAVALLGWRSERAGLACLGAALSVTARPHTVVATALLSLGAWRSGQRGSAVGLGAGSLLGLAVVAGYSLAVFGTPLPVAGYDVEAHVGGLLAHTPWQTLEALGLAFLSPQRGLLIYSPLVIPLLAAAVWSRRNIAAWAGWAALAGVIYLVVQVRAVGHAGGADFFAYRVSLEALLLATPMLAMAGARGVQRSRGFGVVLLLAALVSVSVHTYGAVARSVSPELQQQWAEIDEQVRSEFEDEGVRIEDL